MPPLIDFTEYHPLKEKLRRILNIRPVAVSEWVDLEGFYRNRQSEMYVIIARNDRNYYRVMVVDSVRNAGSRARHAMELFASQIYRKYFAPRDIDPLYISWFHCSLDGTPGVSCQVEINEVRLVIRRRGFKNRQNVSFAGAAFITVAKLTNFGSVTHFYQERDRDWLEELLPEIMIPVTSVYGAHHNR